VLTKLTSYCPVSRYLCGMSCFRGARFTPRFGAFGVGLPGHRQGLKTRKNAPRGIEGDMTSAGEWPAAVLNADIATRFPFSATSGAGCA
jgi:hypothetical protein